MLQVKEVNFAYTDEKTTLQNINFNVNKGEHIAVIGESGCGKSTLLHLIYGKLDVDNGEIVWDNNKILGPAYHLIPGREDTKLLTQEFELMPYTSVEENVKKHLSRMYPEENQIVSDNLLETVEMLPYAKVLVKNLSGGQKQRVALAQALAKKPKLILLDEPFSHIDQFKKNKLRRNLFSYLKKENITCLFATHDIKEMLAFSDFTLVMKSGKIIDYRSPEEVYQNPKSFEVASLFGEVNRINGKLFDREGDFIYYPNEIKLITPTKKHQASVINSYFLGSHYLISILFNEQVIFVINEEHIPKNKKVSLFFSAIDLDKRKI